MKQLRVAPYRRDETPVPSSVASAALAYGSLFSFSFSFSGDRAFTKHLRAARAALAAVIDKEGDAWRVREDGGVVLMDDAHHAALVRAVDQALSQGVPGPLLEAFDDLVDWLAGAQAVDPNAIVKRAAKKATL